MRIHYLDNLRCLTVLLLFPYHTFMIYNNFGESFYIKGQDLTATSSFIAALWPWMMPLMFTIAGISSAYALNKRKSLQYLQERLSKLFVPLIFGILLIMPAITYFAERFHNSYTGGYLFQYVLFFTKPTDLTGYQGGFTPGHLWFILYLFVISLLALPIMTLSKGKNIRLNSKRLPLLILLMLFAVPLVMRPLLNISGKSVGEYFAFFMLGYFVICDEDVVKKLDSYKWLLTGLSIAGMIFTVTAFILKIDINPILYDILTAFYAWCTILALLGLGRHYLNVRNKVTDYLSKSSFSVYLFHQLWIVVSAFYIFNITKSPTLQIVLILLCSIPLTFFTHEIFKRFAVTRWLFGIKG